MAAKKKTRSGKASGSRKAKRTARKSAPKKKAPRKQAARKKAAPKKTARKKASGKAARKSGAARGRAGAETPSYIDPVREMARSFATRLLG